MIDDVRLIGKRVIEALPLVRTRVRQHRHDRVLDGAASVTEGLSAFAERWGDGAPCDDAPIFILSAGWRSGSALLHRLIMSSNDVFLWGEPYHECAYVQRMADSLRAFGDANPADGVFHQPHANGRTNGNGAHHDKAVPPDDERFAYYFPAAEHLLAAHRAFFDRLLAEPARDGGFSRWGFKAVRLSIEHAHYLRWLYPNARLLLQIRNPYKAYRSYRLNRGLYSRWPHQPVLTAEDFGAFWLDAARGFVEGHGELGARLVRFEELAVTDGPLIDDLSGYLGVPLRKEVLDDELRERRWPTPAIPASELAALRRAVEPFASAQGYEPTLG